MLLSPANTMRSIDMLKNSMKIKRASLKRVPHRTAVSLQV